MKRKVKIELRNGTYFVLYVERAKYTRYGAAQFDSRYSTIEQVKDWIKKQTNLMLVDEIKA